MIRMYDIIVKKQERKALSEEEVAFFVEGVTDGSIPDYQISAFLMAVYFNGMDEGETALLTRHMANSGDMVDLSAIKGIKVDKHSTGGVGDKTTLVVGPLVAACGVKVAKMSGRGLAHTGGTVDKLESIPGFKTEIDRSGFIDIVNRVGISVIGQSGNLAPADKKLYALRDVTATVKSIPLIASSIMSKKLAAGSDCILLDVKTGSGAFMKTKSDSVSLARSMVDIGEHEGRRTVAVISDMDRPLGNAIGNSLEIMEAVRTLKGDGPSDLTHICIELAANMLFLAQKGRLSECRTMIRELLRDGRGFDKLSEMVAAQGGDASILDDASRLTAAPVKVGVAAPKKGYIAQMDTEMCGNAAALLGAGRLTKDSPIDHLAGIMLKAKTGSYVNEGDEIAELFTSDASLIEDAQNQLLASITVSEAAPDEKPILLARVAADGVHDY